jgi:hypothetical protein
LNSQNPALSQQLLISSLGESSKPRIREDSFGDLIGLWEKIAVGFDFDIDHPSLQRVPRNNLVTLKRFPVPRVLSYWIGFQR